jgi:hypothetical protein
MDIVKAYDIFIIAQVKATSLINSGITLQKQGLVGDAITHYRQAVVIADEEV